MSEPQVIWAQRQWTDAEWREFLILLFGPPN